VLFDPNFYSQDVHVDQFTLFKKSKNFDNWGLKFVLVKSIGLNDRRKAHKASHYTNCYFNYIADNRIEIIN